MTLLDADEKPHPVVGEDTWELFELIEESFEVDLGDYYALAGISAGELAERIRELANYSTEDRCLCAVSFYKLRRAFEDLFSVPRTSVRPKASTGKLLPWSSRNSQWRSLEERLGLTLPKLVFPSWLLWLCLFASVALPVCAREFIGFRISVLTIFFASTVLFFLTVAACVPLARGLPLNCGTIGELARVVISRNYATFAKQYGSSSEQGLLHALQLLIATEMGVEVREVSSETRIPTDLNIY